MKTILFCALSFFTFSGQNLAFAGCSGLPLSTANIKTLLDGNTICTTDSQEQHRNSVSSGVEPNVVLSGELWDYKKGASDPIDPTSQVGTWSIHDDKVYYTYGSSTFENSVYSPDMTNICFDNGKTQITATKKTGIVSCQSF